MEIWKPIENYEGLYEVSSYGRVRSVDAPINAGLKYNDHRIRKGRVLKQNAKRNGYFTVDLSKDNKVKTISVHRIVATAFLEKTEGANVVNHKNCNKHDNRVENLEWCTAQYNREHAKENGRYHNPNGKAVECMQNHRVFSSSYEAAEWVNETVFKNSRQVKNLASKIRAACLGAQKSAYHFTWRNA